MKQHKVHWKEFPGKATPEEPDTQEAPERESKFRPKLEDARRCIAHSTTSGKPCRKWAMAGQRVCRSHGGAAPAAKRNAAERILLAADGAAARLVQWMNDPTVPMPLRMRAAQDLLDRASITGRQELVIEDKRYERLMGGITRERPANAGPAPEPGVGGLSRARPSFDPERHIEPAPPGTLALPPAERPVTVGEVLDVVEAELVEERPPVVPRNPMASFEELYGDVPNPMDPPLYGRSARLGRSEYGT